MENTRRRTPRRVSRRVRKTLVGVPVAARSRIAKSFAVVGSLLAVALLAAVFLFSRVSVNAGAADNVFGYAFTKDFGYLSLNCNNTSALDGSGTRTDDCAVPFGATIASNNKFSGLGWGPGIGWVCFGETCNGMQLAGGVTLPNDFAAQVSSSTGSKGDLDGHATSGKGGYAMTFGSGGELALSGTATDGSPFGGFVNTTGASTSNTNGRCKNEDGNDMTVAAGEFCGLAYNSTLGFLRFRGVIAISKEVGQDPPTVIPLSPNPATKNPTEAPTFSWVTVDPEGDGQAAAELVVCKAALNPNCENAQSSGAQIFRGVLTGATQSCTYPCSASSGTVDLVSGLQAHWKFDGNTNDSAGTNHGVAGGDAQPANGIVGQGYAFDGAGDFVRMPSSNLWALKGDFTISFWMYPRSSALYQSILADYWVGGTGTPPDQNLLYYGAEQRFQWWRGDYFLSTPAGSVPRDQWSRIILRRLGGEVTAFVYDQNQQLRVKSSSVFPDQIGRGVNLWVGILGDEASYPLNAIIDDLRFYDRALDSEAVKALAVLPAVSTLPAGVPYSWKVRATDNAHPLASQPFSSASEFFVQPP